MGIVFPDPRLVAAIVDWVTSNAHILEGGTPVQPAPHHQDHHPAAGAAAVQHNGEPAVQLAGHLLGQPGDLAG
jgi:hypothetical protein